MLPDSKFHISVLDRLSDEVLVRIYEQWLRGRGDGSFHVLNFPKLISSSVKVRCLLFESRGIMRTRLIGEAVSTGARVAQPLVVRVRREHVFEDALKAIQAINIEDFRKPLKVIFEGEQGLDAGGVRKEFFQLLSAEIFERGGHAKLFRIVNEESGQLWFSGADAVTSIRGSDSQTDKLKNLLNGEVDGDPISGYYLVGILLGFALFNQTILPIEFRAHSTISFSMVWTKDQLSMTSPILTLTTRKG